MEFENKECIDQGTAYCPCHLFETGDCIICDPPSEKKGCNCVNWKGVCIYQEYIWNGNKPKKYRETFQGEIIRKENYEGGINIFTIKVPVSIVKELKYPGSFVFIRGENTSIYYDMPISIMDYDVENGLIKVAIETRGVKTKTFTNLDVGGKIFLRAPFWNGILGLKNIYERKNEQVLMIVRGIGAAPGIPVIKKLNENNNKIKLIMDSGGKDITFINSYIEDCSVEASEVSMLCSGQLTTEFKSSLIQEKDKNEIKLIHCDGPDILIYNIINFLEEIQYKVPVSCCNNAKMCCGEGICGGCTARYKNHNVKRLCKLQIEPDKLFKDRRLI